ncbi:actin-like ATPase domain-containing protein [Daedalea quercina L-15889]|uniref:Actin-like ATPase domain-containing protein n=1 Tax=Daedalea quercina L-15889 TaxID=1314783 RepID=A0A165RG88_9APHY|nr:actin-like ATPase domain-containing protein [Daedalea quercina L-15889]
MMSIRESSVVVLDTSRTSIRAVLGLHDLLRTPSVEVQARVGLPRSLLHEVNGDTHSSPSTSKAANGAVSPNVRVTDYLVGTQLQDALAAGQDIVEYWPFAEADIRDWTQAEALWKHILFNQLHLRRTQMESAVLLSLPPGLSRDAYERLCQLFFERFNVAGFGILERPVAQFFSAVNANSGLSGVVVDMDREWTDIAPIYDGFLVNTARMSVRVGMEDCKRYLAGLLRGNQSIMTALLEPVEGENPLDEDAQQAALEGLAHQLWSEGHVKVLAEGEAAAQDAEDLNADGDINIAAIVVAGKEKAVIEKGMKNKAARANAVEQARAKEIEARDLIEVQWRGKTVTIGKERHRFCEPLFDVGVRESAKGKEREKDVVQSLSVQAAVAEAVARTDFDQRQYIWQGLFVTGEVTNHIKGLGAALQTRLTSLLPLNVDPQHNEVQPRAIRTLRIPDYFAEYRDKGDGLASFLGTSIVAKITFSETAGKNFVSKGDYVSMGPRAVLGMSPALL